jgi:hypothetical protein
MTIKLATGQDFDRMNNRVAYDALTELARYASGIEGLPATVTARAIESRSHFVMEVW